MIIRKHVIACLAATILLAGCSSHNEPPHAFSAAAGSSTAAASSRASLLAAQAAARAVAERFGRQMQKISVLAPAPAVREELPKVYGGLLSPQLLAQWRAHPDETIGREGSSPWPQRITVHRVDCGQPDACRVIGDVDYITSNEVAHGGVFKRRKISMEVARNGKDWRILSMRLKPARE